MKNLMMIVLLCGFASFSAAGEFTIAAAARLTGCWQGTENPGMQEHWMAPADGMMLGISRNIREGKSTQYEFLRIVAEQGSVAYVAKPSGQPEASFNLVTIEEKKLIFENPDHDFPQRIIYIFETEDTLTARIEGKNNGKDRGFDFPMKRVACPESRN